MDKTYKCDLCQETYEGIGEEDALQEADELFPGTPVEDLAQVCEDCFIKIMDFNEPGLKRYEKYLEKLRG